MYLFQNLSAAGCFSGVIHKWQPFITSGAVQILGLCRNNIKGCFCIFLLLNRIRKCASQYNRFYALLNFKTMRVLLQVILSLITITCDFQLRISTMITGPGPIVPMTTTELGGIMLASIQT